MRKSVSSRAWDGTEHANLKGIMRMKTAVLLFAAAALACHGRQQTAQRAQQQYDVIQEGQTTSASTTVGAPGEQVRPPVTTATNTDTTGSFTLSTAAPAANMPGGPATGVLPPQQPGAMTAGSPPPMASGAPTVRVPPQPAPIAVSTAPQGTPPPRATPRRPPPPAPPTSDTTTSGETSGTSGTTDTMTTSTQPPPTDTTSTEKPKKDKSKDDSQKTDTSAPPPPPTQTDTIGDHR
jgi:hypothetical protein